ncbi:MAG TPA: hypothetical protein VGB29_07425 [Thermodesulfobacteriota bacterium]|jgi:hypothetical protein
MRLSVRGLMFALAFFWALVIAVVGALNILYPGYAADYLKMIVSLYPWYKATGTTIDLVYGIVTGFVDGLICGLIFALLYNLFTGKGKKAAPRRAAARRAPARRRPAARKRPAAKRKRPAAKRKRPAAKRKRPAAKKRRR